MDSKTLSLKKKVFATKPDAAPQPHKPEKSLIGKTVVIQTKSPSQITGVIEGYGNGLFSVRGVERRWDGNELSDVVMAGLFQLDRNSVTYICEANHD